MSEFSKTPGPQDDPVNRVEFPLLDDGTPPPPELVERIRRWLRHEPRGQQLMAFMQGEGPEPEPLFTAIRQEDGATSLLLGAGEVDVTDIEPLADTLLPVIFQQDDQQN